jgi:threonine dehydrogenase-like Zn-dependent dehydrogenase
LGVAKRLGATSIIVAAGSKAAEAVRKITGGRGVDTATTPMLLKTVQARKLDPKKLITHRFGLDKILDAYDTFGHAAKTRALKVIVTA